jgi:SAM-dependent methyltransferase
VRGPGRGRAYNCQVPDENLTAQEAEYEAILVRLRDEVDQGDGDLGGDDGVDRYTRRRREAEGLWAVSAERPFLSRPGRWGRLRGSLLTPAKGVLRKLMRWYVEPLAVDQRRFNSAALKLADTLSERGDEHFAALEGQLNRLEEELRPKTELTVELDERLTRLERRKRTAVAPVASAPASTPGQSAFPDYFAYESRMRGPTESVRERQRLYVEDFREAAPVLDLGCGRGEFLGLLREAGLDARGVDLDADMVAFARGEDLDVEQTGAVEYLESIEDASLGGIFAAQVVEHLPPPVLVRLMELAAVKLRPGGLLVAETINPLSPLALRNYFADLTHAQPLVPETLELLARQSGFDSVEVRFANEPEQKLEEPADPTIAANVRRLNELLFAPLDYAILART